MTFKDVALSLLTSKKVLSAIAGVLCLVGVRYLKLPEETVGPLSLQITTVVAALLVGQGAADLGKAGKQPDGETMKPLAAMELGFIEGDEEDGEG